MSYKQLKNMKKMGLWLREKIYLKKKNRSLPGFTGSPKFWVNPTR